MSWIDILVMRIIIPSAIIIAAITIASDSSYKQGYKAGVKATCPTVVKSTVARR